MDKTATFEMPSPTEVLVRNGETIETGAINKLVTEDTDKSWELLVDYIKQNIATRLEQVMLAINFDLVKSENHDTYIENKRVVAALLAEEDGVIDANKREQARLLLKSLRN